MPKLRSVAVAAALVAAASLPVTPAHASHTCSLDEERSTLEEICESHPDLSVLDKLFCLVWPGC